MKIDVLTGWKLFKVEEVWNHPDVPQDWIGGFDVALWFEKDGETAVALYGAEAGPSMIEAVGTDIASAVKNMIEAEQEAQKNRLDNWRAEQ